MSKSASQRVQRNATNQANTANRMGQDYANRAGLGYENFANTGGISGQQRALTGQEAASNVNAVYDSLKNNLARRQKIQGGYSPGLGANESALGRGAAAATSGAVNQANLGLDELQTRNQLAAMGGLSGLAGTELGTGSQNLSIAERAAAAQPGFMQQLGQGIGIARGAFGLMNPERYG